MNTVQASVLHIGMTPEGCCNLYGNTRKAQNTQRTTRKQYKLKRNMQAPQYKSVQRLPEKLHEYKHITGRPVIIDNRLSLFLHRHYFGCYSCHVPHAKVCVVLSAWEAQKVSKKAAIDCNCCCCSCHDTGECTMRDPRTRLLWYEAMTEADILQPSRDTPAQ